MATSRDTGPVKATCHCGAIVIVLAKAPSEITQCNCSLCRSYGVIWTYVEADGINMAVDLRTDTYAWNGRHVDFHRCSLCGCVTHWTPRDAKRSDRGINANLLPADVVRSARLRHLDGAGTGKYLD